MPPPPPPAHKPAPLGPGIEPVPVGPVGRRRRDFGQMRELHEWIARAVMRGERISDISHHTRVGLSRLQPVLDGTSRYLKSTTARAMRELARRRRNEAMTAPPGPPPVAPPPPPHSEDPASEIERLRRLVVLQALELADLKDSMVTQLG